MIVRAAAARVADAMDALISPEPARREIFGDERLVVTLCGGGEA
jgi:hypothetical protein